ncbi:MAG: glycosyltransferase family A protein [Eubacteriales bacterium]|nr:glycosyltransferase family A protein [Eubacteriales bacterium]
MKVTVIIPVYNAMPYLEQCLNSIVGQTLRDIEILCVDDGSTDGSAELLEQYARGDNRVRLLKQEHQFAGAARNLGLAQAQGEYVQFLDADDFYERNMLELMYARLVETGADLCACLGQLYDQRVERFTGEYFLKKECIPHDRSTFRAIELGADAFRFSMLGPTNKLIRRSLLVDHGLSFSGTRNTNDFYCMSMAIALADSICIYDERPLLCYRINAGGNTRSKLPLAPLDFANETLKLKRSLDKAGLFQDFSVAYFEVAISVLCDVVYKLREYPEALSKLQAWYAVHGAEAYPLKVTELESGTLCNFLMLFDGITRDTKSQELSERLIHNAECNLGHATGLSPKRGAFLLRKLISLEGIGKGTAHCFRIVFQAISKRRRAGTRGLKR